MLFLLIAIEDLKVTEVKDTTVKFSWVVKLEWDKWENTTIYVFPDENTSTSPVSECNVTDRNAEQTCTAESLFSNTRYSGVGVVFGKSQNNRSEPLSRTTINFQTTPRSKFHFYTSFLSLN